MVEQFIPNRSMFRSVEEVAIGVCRVVEPVTKRLIYVGRNLHPEESKLEVEVSPLEISNAKLQVKYPLLQFERDWKAIVDRETSEFEQAGAEKAGERIKVVGVFLPQLLPQRYVVKDGVSADQGRNPLRLLPITHHAKSLPGPRRAGTRRSPVSSHPDGETWQGVAETWEG